MRVLQKSNLLLYLQQAFLLEDYAPVLEGQAIVVEHRLRHRSFSLELPEGGLFIKQSAKGEVSNDLVKEAEFYHWMRQQSYGEIKLPEFIGYDHRNQILVLSGLRGRSLLNAFLSSNRFDVFDGERVASSLLDLKLLSRTSNAQLVFPVVSDSFSQNWIFYLEQYLRDHYASLVGATGQLLPIISSFPSLRRYMEASHSLWRTEGLMHGDLKWENLFMTDAGNGEANKDPYFIDWESVAIGDPVWDVAAFVQSGLARLCAAKGRSEALSEVDAQPYATQLQPFWSRWFTENSYHEQESRLLSFTAVRLIQTAYEHASISEALSPPIYAMISTAWQMFSDKHYAKKLLGLSL